VAAALLQFAAQVESIGSHFLPWPGWRRLAGDELRDDLDVVCSPEAYLLPAA
jgi:hypothetical protein